MIEYEYDLQVLMEVLIDDYGVHVQGVDVDGIYIAETGMMLASVKEAMEEISRYEAGFSGMGFDIYRAPEGSFIEVFEQY